MVSRSWLVVGGGRQTITNHYPLHYHFPQGTRDAMGGQSTGGFHWLGRVSALGGQRECGGAGARSERVGDLRRTSCGLCQRRVWKPSRADAEYRSAGGRGRLFRSGLLQ